MILDPDKNNNQNELFERACRFIERMIEKKAAMEAESNRENERHQARNTWAGIGLVVVTLGVGAAGLIYKAYAENHDRDAKTMREANRRKLEIISDISGAITSMRELNEVALVYCKTKMNPEQRQKLQVKRVEKGFEVLKAARPKLHFFNDKFRTLIIEFLAWEEKIPDYCAPSAPSEQEWRHWQKRIEDEMVLSPPILFADS